MTEIFQGAGSEYETMLPNEHKGYCILNLYLKLSQKARDFFNFLFAFFVIRINMN